MLLCSYHVFYLVGVDSFTFNPLLLTGRFLGRDILQGVFRPLCPRKSEAASLASGETNPARLCRTGEQLALLDTPQFATWPLLLLLLLLLLLVLQAVEVRRMAGMMHPFLREY